eukprot:CAMPEP_0113538780 /NCGR_PEP_ID=MMETSP0015_2-20120614/7556_1 /TAXON_ID=2838 /ORGANISM="Odontella" /LENGTH=510 /DNA_ID=CAMNT_0000438393 /DNA_START=123 /DNA_END=1655 /DNA_ORIENTATION=- /assembly_acc=CAM_ASM_000160
MTDRNTLAPARRGAAAALSLGLLLLVLSPPSAHAFSPFARVPHGAAKLDPAMRHASLSSAASVAVRAAASPEYAGLKMSSVAAEGGGEEEVGGGSSTMPNHIFNLIKSIVGAGVLSLPAGISSFADAPSGILPATALIAAIGIISGYGFSLIGRVCSYTGATSYRDAWDKTVGTSTSWIPSASCTFKTSVAVLAYSMILADTFKSLLFTAGMNVSRTNTLFGVTGLVLLPLCLLKDLSSLAPFSLLGTIGMMYTAVAMGIRYFGGSYALPAGKFLADIPANMQPAFGTTGAAGVLNPNSFILICMLSTAYMAHFNAPKFFNELKNNTIKRYNTVVSTSFAASIAIFAAIASIGFLTFGSASSGLILNNYSTKDALMGLSRIAVAVSLVFSYPLAFTGFRDGVIDLFSIPEEKRTNSFLNKLTVGLLGIITGAALVVKDLSFVLSFGGATLGNALIYVYPALMFRSAVKAMGEKATKGMKREVKVAMSSAGLGVTMGAIGARMALKSLFAS